MKKYLEYNDSKSRKFWQIEVVGSTFTVTYGKIGTNGQSKTKTLETAEKADSEANRVIQQKLKKGYQEIKQNETQEVSPPKNDYTSEKVQNFKKKFAPYQLPNTLIELIKFDDLLTHKSYYSQSFYLNDEIEDDFFETWLDNGETNSEKRKEYAKNMIVFANADGTGGSYAMWIQDGNINLEHAPIITYGSEGAIQVIAENLRDLIQMLSFGAEGMDGSFCHYVEDEDFYEDFIERRPNLLKFRQWMKETLNIEPVSIDCLKLSECDASDAIEELIEKAQKTYKKAFDEWQYQFYPNWGC